MTNGMQSMTIEILEPEEEATLAYVKERWEKEKESISMKDISNEFLKEEYGYTSHEKARQLLYSLFRKGQILIDIRGKERLCRPNHVTVYSKSKPMDFRNITIIDEEKDFPASRIWMSVYKDGKNQPYMNVSESKRSPQSGGGWKTVNSIMIPPEALEDFAVMMKYMVEKVKELNKT